MKLEFREFREGDIKFALGITDAEKWYLTAHDLSFYLHTGKGTGIVAEADGENIGFATAALYGRTAWIGNVVVDARRRQAGIGGRLVAELMSLLRNSGASTILLYAYDRSRPLYERMGFTFDSTIWEVEIEKRKWKKSGPLRSGMREDIGAFDMTYFHQSRMPVLLHVSERSGCIVLSSTDKQGNVDGYLLCSPGGEDYGSEIAPFIAPERQVLKMLASLKDAPGPFHLYVPESNEVALGRLGLEPTRLRRIHRGFTGSQADVPILNGNVFSVGLLESG